MNNLHLMPLKRTTMGEYGLNSTQWLQHDGSYGRESTSIINDALIMADRAAYLKYLHDHVKNLNEQKKAHRKVWDNDGMHYEWFTKDGKPTRNYDISTAKAAENELLEFTRKYGDAFPKR